MSMRHRSLEREYMDDHTPPPHVIDEVYGFLGRLNRWLGGTRATRLRFEAFSRSWRQGARVEVLDVACGGGDVGRALMTWGRQQGFDVRVTSIDLSAHALDYARGEDSETTDGPGLRLVRADVRHLPFRDGAFDYVTSTLFFHHLTDDEVVSTLQVFGRLARRGLVVNDLIRRRRLYIWSWLFTRPFNDVLRQDGPLSVRRAFRPQELAALARRAGLGWLTVREHFGHRMTLAGASPH